METKTCNACGRTFTPRPQNPNQNYCTNSECQLERRRRWQQQKRRNSTFLNGHEEAFLALLQQSKDAGHANLREASPGSNLLRAVPLVAELLDAGEDFQRTALATSDVLCQAHDKGVLIGDRHHQCRYGRLAQVLERIEASFATA